MQDQSAAAAGNRDGDTPLAHVRDRYLDGVIQPTMEAGDELIGWTRLCFRSADGTEWARLPVVKTRAGELMIMVPMAFQLPAARSDGVDRA